MPDRDFTRSSLTHITMCAKTLSTHPMQSDRCYDPETPLPTPSPSHCSDNPSDAVISLPPKIHLSHLDLSPPSTCWYPLLFNTPSLRNGLQSPPRSMTTSPPFHLIPTWTPSPEIGSPLSLISKRKMWTPRAPLVPLTTQSKSSGIARRFAHLHLRPRHPLLHAYPRPLSLAASPALSLSIRPPPSLRRYLSRQTGEMERVPLRQSGLVLRLLFFPHPHPLPLPLPLLLDTAGNAAAQGISSRDVQSHVLERERMSWQGTLCVSTMNIVSCY